MLEAYTTLGYLAANTSRARLITVVTGVVYRYPGVLAKTVNTLDILSGGRGMLGIGAGWNEYEAKRLLLAHPADHDPGVRARETLGRVQRTLEHELLTFKT